MLPGLAQDDAEPKTIARKSAAACRSDAAATRAAAWILDADRPSRQLRATKQSPPWDCSEEHRFVASSRLMGPTRRR